MLNQQRGIWLLCSSDERISHHGRVLKSVSAHGARNVRLSSVVRTSLVRGSLVSRPWFARLSSVVRSSLVRDSLVSRPWFARLSSVIRSSLVRGSPTGIGDGLANCFIIGSIINLKMYCCSIKGKPYSLYGVEQSGMKARRVLLQNRSIEIYSWLWIICFGSEAYSFPIKRNRPWFWAVLARNHGRIR